MQLLLKYTDDTYFEEKVASDVSTMCHPKLRILSLCPEKVCLIGLVCKVVKNLNQSSHIYFPNSHTLTHPDVSAHLHQNPREGAISGNPS